MPEALSNAQRLSLPNMVFVQLSTYGFDNTWVLDCLRAVGPNHGRGVVSFDPAQTSSQTLSDWHDIGVRGVRLNFRSSKMKVSREAIQNQLRAYAEKLRPLKTWSIGLYADMQVLEHVQPILPSLDGVKLVLEHFGSPSALPLNPFSQPGWSALTSMMEHPSVYVKISAPYLFSKDDNAAGLEQFATLTKALMRMRGGEGIVFGSDWPHTQARGYDVVPFMEKMVQWCGGNEDLKRNLFRDNARRLWDVDEM